LRGQQKCLNALSLIREAWRELEGFREVWDVSELSGRLWKLLEDSS
jgi:hypothetical protein